MEKNKEHRIVYLDCLRILSIFFMIMLHVASSNWKKVPVASFDWRAFTFYDGIAKFCVPVFVMISGALFLNKEKEYNYEKLKKNILHIVKVFMIWSFVYTVYKFKWKIFTIGEIKTVLEYFLLGHSRFWFLWMIVGIYLLVPFLKKIAEEKNLVEIYILMFFLFVSFHGMFEEFCGEESLPVQMVNELRVDFFGGYVGYFFLGHYLHMYELKKGRRWFLYILGILSAIFTVLGTIVISSTPAGATSELLGNLKPNIAFMSIAVFLLFKQIVKQDRIKEDWKKKIVKTSDLCLGIYMVHTLVESLLKRCGWTTLSVSGVFSVPILTIIIFLISLGICYVLKKNVVLRNML